MSSEQSSSSSSSRRMLSQSATSSQSSSSSRSGRNSAPGSGSSTNAVSVNENNNIDRKPRNSKKRAGSPIPIKSKSRKTRTVQQAGCASQYLNADGSGPSSSSSSAPVVPEPADLNPELNKTKLQRAHGKITLNQHDTDIRKIWGVKTEYHYPIKTATPPLRTNFIVNASKTLATLDKEASLTCFHCKTNDSRQLFRCHGCVPKFEQNRCQTHFHAECLVNYNADNFSAQYNSQKQCQDGVFCPLHSCAACAAEKNMQTAYSGTLVQCALCYRAFHEKTCIPAGYEPVEMRMKIGKSEKDVSMVICNSHVENLPLPLHHVNACCKCSTPALNQELMSCSTCPRKTHVTCFEVLEVNGVQLGTDDDGEDAELLHQCDLCVTKKTFRIESPVLVRSEIGTVWQYGKTRKWDSLNVNTNGIPGYENYQKVGYVLLDLDGKFSIVPVNQVVQLYEHFKEWPLEHSVAQWYQNLAAYLKEFQAKLPDYLKVCHTQRDFCVPAEGINFPKPRGLGQPKGNRKHAANGMENEKLIISLTENKGYGVFAKKNIAKGEFLAVYVGELLNAEEKKKRLALTRCDSQAALYMLDCHKEVTIDSAAEGNCARYVNHSCDPNAKTVFRRVNVNGRSEPRAYFVAIKKIGAGEEITINYEMGGGSNRRSRECYCGAEICAGTLAGPTKTAQKEYEKKKKEQ